MRTIAQAIQLRMHLEQTKSNLKNKTAQLGSSYVRGSSACKNGFILHTCFGINSACVSISRDYFFNTKRIESKNNDMETDEPTFICCWLAMNYDCHNCISPKRKDIKRIYISWNKLENDLHE